MVYAYKIQALDFALTICKLSSLTGFSRRKDFFFLGKTDEEISLVCKTEETPPQTIERSDGWKGFRIQGTLDFSLVGILAELSGILAKQKIVIFVVSTFNTDYILVKAEQYGLALDTLRKEGYQIFY